MSGQFKSTEYVLRVLRDADVEVSHMNENEGCIWLAIPVDNPIKDGKMREINLELLTAVVNQIKLDSDSGDLTAVEELFLGLENAEEQLRAFLPEQSEEV